MFFFPFFGFFFSCFREFFLVFLIFFWFVEAFLYCTSHRWNFWFPEVLVGYYSYSCWQWCWSVPIVIDFFIFIFEKENFLYINTKIITYDLVLITNKNSSGPFFIDLIALNNTRWLTSITIIILLDANRNLVEWGWARLCNSIITQKWLFKVRLVIRKEREVTLFDREGLFRKPSRLYENWNNRKYYLLKPKIESFL